MNPSQHGKFDFYTSWSLKTKIKSFERKSGNHEKLPVLHVKVRVRNKLYSVWFSWGIIELLMNAFSHFIIFWLSLQKVIRFVIFDNSSIRPSWILPAFLRINLKDILGFSMWLVKLVIYSNFNLSIIILVWIFSITTVPWFIFYSNFNYDWTWNWLKI